MTRRELIDFCLTFPADYEDYPLDEIIDVGAWTVMRHKMTEKATRIFTRGTESCAPT
jgi:hypothetical protein